MTFLPIVTRELRVAARRRGTFWGRCLTAALAIIAGFLVYLANWESPPHEIGEALFWIISAGAFVYCLFTGVRSTADCLSEEKREGTLGLLFLTDLKGYDVVGGKLVATSLNAFYGLLSILPVLAIPLLMGGVTKGEFWRMALVLANTFFFSLATGMLMSALSKSPRRAMAATFVLLLFSSLGLMLGTEMIPSIYNSAALTRLCQLFNPGYSMTLVPDLVFKRGAEDFWWSAGIIQVLAWLFLVLASIILPRSWQEHASGAKGGRWRESWHRWSYGNNSERTAFRHRLLGVNAFYWLAGRARLKPVYVWAALAFIACLWAWGTLENGRSWMDSGTYVITAIILNSMLKLWVTSEAGRRLGEDRKLGALELLLSTPLSVRDIIHGQMLALRRQFLGPILAVLLVEFVFLLASLKDIGPNTGDIDSTIAFWAAATVMLVADILALSVVAMWVGLSTKNPNRTTGITVIRVLVLPLVIFFLIWIFSSMAGGTDLGWQFVLAAWFLPGIFADAFFGLRAWHRLRTEFREVAAHRFVPRPGLWRRLFGSRGAGPIPAPIEP